MNKSTIGVLLPIFSRNSGVKSLQEVIHAAHVHVSSVSVRQAGRSRSDPLLVNQVVGTEALARLGLRLVSREVPIGHAEHRLFELV